MAGLADDPNDIRPTPSEDPEVAAYSILAQPRETPSGNEAVAYALLALVREIKGLRRDIHKMGGKPPTMKRKFQ